MTLIHLALAVIALAAVIFLAYTGKDIPPNLTRILDVLLGGILGYTGTQAIGTRRGEPPTLNSPPPQSQPRRDQGN